MWITYDKTALVEKIGGSKRPIILVPTMGALHEGHCALIDHARQLAGGDGTVIVSIFVNPIQFDRATDLESYPRTMKDDLHLCHKHGADGVFVPDAFEMYAADRSVTVTESKLSENLCGVSRPGHFDGVCTVVLKLFHLTRCDLAVFGEKDFQQLAIIRRMVRDLDVPVEIVSHPTLREADGLAMSSRNRRLSQEHRKDAPNIHAALLAAREKPTASGIMDTAREMILRSGHAKIDYLSVIDAETLESTIDLTRPAVLATAVFYGDVRLIDHVSIAR